LELILQRIDRGTESSLGYITIKEGLTSWLECFTCEDEKRVNKIKGKTRIPQGRYEIKLRNEGGMNGRYRSRFTWHKGMLWLQNVENFEWVYIHVGNTHEDTEGCILVGAGAHHNSLEGGGSIISSTAAYARIYEKIIGGLEHGPVYITIDDEPT
jgi:hypothetical protein